MKTSVAYIHEASERRLDQEERVPTLPAVMREAALQNRLTLVAGIAVDDTEGVLAAARQARRERMEKYKADRVELLAQLREAGISPLAVLPSTVWMQICKKSGLIRLLPEGGRVKVAPGVFEAQLSTQQFLKIAGSIGLLCSIGGCALVFLLFGFDVSLLVQAAIGSFFVGCCLLAIMADAGSITALVRPFRLRRLAQRPSEDIIRALFPNGVSHERTDQDDDDDDEEDERPEYTVGLILPDPPAEVGAVLLKARRLKPWVAAVPGAIGFAESLEEIAERQQREMAEWERRRERLRQDDPIVYHECGSATAILAQFGDFPIEQQVVDSVLVEEFLV